jgi:hypothetical protein
MPQGGSDRLQRPVDLIARDYQWRGDPNGVVMGVLGEDASALQGLTVAARIAYFRVKLLMAVSTASAPLFIGNTCASRSAPRSARRTGPIDGCERRARSTSACSPAPPWRTRLLWRPRRLRTFLRRWWRHDRAEHCLSGKRAATRRGSACTKYDAVRSGVSYAKQVNPAVFGIEGSTTLVINLLHVAPPSCKQAKRPLRLPPNQTSRNHRPCRNT